MLFEVIDLRSDTIETSEIVENVSSPEEAARKALGIDVFRSGRKHNLVARVYWQRAGEPKNMVRLYAKSAFPDALPR